MSEKIVPEPVDPQPIIERSTKQRIIGFVIAILFNMLIYIGGLLLIKIFATNEMLLLFIVIFGGVIALNLYNLYVLLFWQNANGSTIFRPHPKQNTPTEK